MNCCPQCIPWRHRLFGAVKAIFDPANLLNPGVIVDPAAVDDDLVPQAKPTKAARLRLRHDGVLSSPRCTDASGSESAGLTQPRRWCDCLSYLATKDETHSTRGRARVLQEMVNGTVVSDGWRSPEVADALDLCLSCKDVHRTVRQVSIWLPTGRSPLSAVSKAGRPRTTRSAGCPDGRSLLLDAESANAAMKPKPIAAPEEACGIDQRRPLPAFAQPSALGSPNIPAQGDRSCSGWIHSQRLLT